MSNYLQSDPHGLVAQWITRLPTEQKIPGSSPGKIAYFWSILFDFTSWPSRAFRCNCTLPGQRLHERLLVGLFRIPSLRISSLYVFRTYLRSNFDDNWYFLKLYPWEQLCLPFQRSSLAHKREQLHEQRLRQSQYYPQSAARISPRSSVILETITYHFFSTIFYQEEFRDQTASSNFLVQK